MKKLILYSVVAFLILDSGFAQVLSNSIIECYSTLNQREKYPYYYIGVQDGIGKIFTKQQHSPAWIDVIYEDNYVLFRISGTNLYLTWTNDNNLIKAVEGKSDRAKFIKRKAIGTDNTSFFSYESATESNHYLRHTNYIMYVHDASNPPQKEFFKQDASFKIEAGLLEPTKDIEDENPGLFGIHKIQCYSVFESRDDKELFYIGKNNNKGIIVTTKKDGKYKQQYGEPTVFEIRYRQDAGITAVIFKDQASGKYYSVSGKEIRLVDNFSDAAIFYPRPNLAKKDARAWFSFESKVLPGYYLRHFAFILYVHPVENKEIYRQDATFRILE